MRNEPTALKIYKWLFLSIVLLHTIFMVRSDPYTPLAASILMAGIINGAIAGFWYLLYRKMVNDKSDVARWILFFLTLPLGLILISSSSYAPDETTTY